MTICALTVLDGIGEEATAIAGVVLLVVAITLAWLSTYVADRGDHILGTILTVGAHASLIGLGGRDSYAAGAPGTDTEDQPDGAEAPEDKPDETEHHPEEGEEGDELLDIQGVNRKRRNAHHGNKERQEELDKRDGEEDEYEEEEEEEETIDEPDSITIRLKYLNDTEELAVLSSNDTIGTLKSKYFHGREHQIKLIWQGQLLQDPRRTLASLNIMHNSVLHCHISMVAIASTTSHQQAPASAPTNTLGTPQGEAGTHSGRMGIRLTGGLRSASLALSSSSLVVPVFVVMLAVVWYFRIHYRQLFTAPATISLVGVTVFFSFFIFGLHSR